MKKTYNISSILTNFQLNQLEFLAKNHTRSQYRQTIGLGKNWLLCRDNETMYLELAEAPFPNSKIMSGTSTSISKNSNQNAIAHNVRENVLHVSQKDRNGYLLKIVNFVESFIKNSVIYGDKKANVHLGVLGYLVFHRFQVNYFNFKGHFLWSLNICAQPTRFKLNDILNNDTITKSRKRIIEKPKQELAISRKFSLSSFKSYNSSKEKQQKQKIPLEKQCRKRVNSLPSISHQQSHEHHKLVINRVEKIKHLQASNKMAKQSGYLKIQRKQRRESKSKLLRLSERLKDYNKNNGDYSGKTANFAQNVNNFGEGSQESDQKFSYGLSTNKNLGSENSNDQLCADDNKNLFSNISLIEKKDQKVESEFQIISLLPEDKNFYKNFQKQEIMEPVISSSAMSSLQYTISACSLQPSDRKKLGDKKQRAKLDNKSQAALRIARRSSLKQEHLKIEKKVEKIQKYSELQRKLRLQTSKKQIMAMDKLQRQQENVEQLESREKDVIKGFLPKFAHNTTLIDQIFETYKQQQQQSQPSKKHRQLSTIPHPLNIPNISQLQQTISQCHNNGQQIQNMLSQLFPIFDKIFKIKITDLTDQQLLFTISNLHSVVQDHQKVIKTSVIEMVKDELKEKERQKLEKLKFQRYRYGVEFKSKEDCIVIQLDVGNDESEQQSDMIEIEEQIGVNTTKKMERMLSKINKQKLQNYQHYYTYNKFMPYYYILSCHLTTTLTKIFLPPLTPTSLILIQLNQVTNITETITNYINKINILYNTILTIYNIIPQKVFHVPQFIIAQIQKQMERRCTQLRDGEKYWKEELLGQYGKYQRYIVEQFEKCGKGGDEEKEKEKEKDGGLGLKDREEQLKQIQVKLEKITSNKTFMKYKNYILDTNKAKLDLIGKYEQAISNIYENSLKTMFSISLQWSQQMARTERLSAEQLAEQESQICLKINHLTKDYISFTKFICLNRRYFYLAPSLEFISKIMSRKSEGEPKQQNEAHVPAMKAQSRRSRQSKFSKQLDLSPEQIFIKILQKSLHYSYNMTTKNASKTSQIHNLVLKHKQRIQIVSKSIEQKQKQNKQEYKQLSSQMRSIIKQIKNRSDILKLNNKIKQIYNRYKIYVDVTKKLHEEMIRNCMIVWEDDQYLERNFIVWNRVVAFLESDIYRKVCFQAVDTVRFQHFFKFYKNLDKLMAVMHGHKFQELFKFQHELSKKQFEAIEMALYKDYTVSQIEQILQTCNMDLRPSATTSKVYDIIKLLKSKPSMYKDLSRIYLHRKKQKFDLNLQKPLKMPIQLSQQQQGELQKIINYDQICVLIEQQTYHTNICTIQQQIRKQQLLTVTKLMEIYQVLWESYVMLREVGCQLKDDVRVNVTVHLEKLKLYYHNALELFALQRNFSKSKANACTKNTNKVYSIKEWQKLLQLHQDLQSHQLRSKFYSNLCVECNRLMMISYTDLIKLMDWSSQSNIVRNVKILFADIVDVQFGNYNQIIALFIARGTNTDRLEIVSGPIPTSNITKCAKFIKHLQKQVQKSIMMMVPNCNGRIGQMKLLAWHLYFTQQVEQQIITNSSLKILQSRLHDTISQIKYDLRYDIQNHKVQQICQLNTFIHYIRQHLRQFPDIDGFQWVNTIRVYEKNKSIMIQQNNVEFYYGFQPKEVRILDCLNWGLGVGVGYGDHGLSPMYRFKAYIIGVPYFQLKQFEKSYLSDDRNIPKLISCLESNSYISTIHKPSNPIYNGIFNEIHKQIINYFYQKSRNAELRNIKNQYDGFNTYSKSGHNIIDSVDQNNLQQRVEVNQIRKLRKVATLTTAFEGVKNQDMFLNSKGKFSLHLCYPTYESIPTCFLGLYRCRNLKIFQPQSLALQTNLLIEQTSIKSQLKSTLIWKISKLMECLKAIKNLSRDDEMKIINKILEIIQRSNEITKDAKNQIYCFIVEHFDLDYSATAAVVNRVFLEEEPTQVQGVQAKTVTNELQLSNSKKIRTRVQLLAKIQAEYNKITKSGKPKTMIIYGEEPTCKSTFIQGKLDQRLNQRGGYIESCLYNESQLSNPGVPVYRTSNSYSNCNKSNQIPFSTIQAGYLWEVPPAVLCQCSLLYVPSIDLESQQSKFELKEYFIRSFLELETRIQEYKVVCKMWTFMLSIYEAYKQIQEYQVTISINIYIDHVLRILTSLISNQYKYVAEAESGRQNEQIEFMQIFVIICYELLSFGLSSRAFRKQFITAVAQRCQKPLTSLKCQIKPQQLQNLTYTSQRQIQKLDQNQLSKQLQNNTEINKQTYFLISLMNRQLLLISRYNQLGISMLIHHNSLHLLQQITRLFKNHCFSQGALSMGGGMGGRACGRDGKGGDMGGGFGKKEVYCQEPSGGFVILANINRLVNVWDKLGIVFQKKKSTYHLSKGLVSGKIMQLSTTRSNFSNSQKQLSQKQQFCLVIIQDLHLSSKPELSHLSCLLNRSYNENIDDHENNKRFLLLNKINEEKQRISNRLRRFVVEIYINQLQVQHIFKYRSQFMMNQEQATIVQEIFHIGLFGDMDLDDVGTVAVDFAIQTIAKMPSQFYSKFLLFKLFKLANSYNLLNLNQCDHKPMTIIQNLIQVLQTSPQTCSLAERIIEKKYCSMYIMEKMGKYSEIDPRKIEMQLKPVLQSLLFQQQLVAQPLLQLLPLIISPTQHYILKNDNLSLLPLLSSKISHSKLVHMTHNYARQLTQSISQISKQKDKYLTLIVPEYLLHDNEFVQFLVILLEGRQIFMENHSMFQFWWDSVLELQYTQNKTDCYQKVKDKLEAVLARVAIVLVVEDLGFDDVINILVGSHEGTGCRSSNGNHQDINDSTNKTVTCKNSSKQKGGNNNKSISNKKSSKSCSNTREQERQESNQNKQRTKRRRIIKKLLLINCELSPQKQIEIIKKVIQHYIHYYEVPTQVINHVKEAMDLLLMIIQDHSTRKIWDDAQSPQFINLNKRNVGEVIANSGQNVFYVVLQAIPKVISRICNKYNQTMEYQSSANLGQCTMSAILGQQQLTNLELIQRLTLKLSKLDRACVKTQKMIRRYKNSQQKLSEQLQQKYKEHEQAKIEEQSMSAIQKYRKLKQGRYFSQQFTKTKTQFLQHRLNPKNSVQFVLQLEKQNTNLDLDKQCEQSQKLKGQTYMTSTSTCVLDCFSIDDADIKFPVGPDFVIEGGVKKKLRDYVCVDGYFVRFKDVDIDFIKIMVELGQDQFTKICDKLRQVKTQIINYQSLKKCLEYSHNITKLLKQSLLQQLYKNKYNAQINQQQDSSNGNFNGNRNRNELQKYLYQYHKMEYINLLDTLSICNHLLSGFHHQLAVHYRVFHVLKDCLHVFVEIGNYRTVQDTPHQPHSNPIQYQHQIRHSLYPGDGSIQTDKRTDNKIDWHKVKYMRNYELEINFEIFEIMCNMVLSKIPNNIGLYYFTHKKLNLQSTNSILYALDHPNIMQPFMQQQIEYKIFNSSSQGESALKKQRPSKRTSIQHKTGSLFPSNHPVQNSSSDKIQPSLSSISSKYLIVYDPYSEFLKYVQTGNNNQLYRKIYYLGACSSPTASPANLCCRAKLEKLNHVPTWYVTYFGNGQQYQKSLQYLNSIVGLLHKKEQKGQGQYDRLVIIVHQKYLCTDLKQNAQLKNNKNRTQIISLQPTQLDLVQPFRQIPSQNNLLSKKTILNIKHKQQWKQKVIVESGLKTQYNGNGGVHGHANSNSNNNGNTNINLGYVSNNNLQTLNSDYAVCKSYLKVLIKNMVDETNQSNKWGVCADGFNIDFKQIQTLVSALKKFQTTKSELLVEYCEQKLINYQYCLDPHNLQAIQGICFVLTHMLKSYTVPMDFVASMGSYTTLQHLVQTCQQSLESSKPAQKSQFFPKTTIQKRLNLQKAYKTILNEYQEYKQQLNSSLYSAYSQKVPQQKLAQSSLQKQKLFIQLIAPHQVIVIVYEHMENWIIRQLLAYNSSFSDKNRLKIIFDQEVFVFQAFIGCVLGASGLGNGSCGYSAGSDGDKNRKILYLVHQNKIQEVKEIFHSVKFLWI